MKNLIALLAAGLVLVVVAVYALLLCPVGEVRRGWSASKRVDAELVHGYPVAAGRTVGIHRAIRRDYPELVRAKYTWQEVRCSIEDYSAQLAFFAYAQVCTLRTVWMVQAHRSRWDDCGSIDAREVGQDADYAVLRARSSMLRPGPSSCAELGGRSVWQFGGDTARLVSGRRPSFTGGDAAWEVFVADVLLSTTMIGCKIALPTCHVTFDRPRMTALDHVRRS